MAEITLPLTEETSIWLAGWLSCEIDRRRMLRRIAHKSKRADFSAEIKRLEEMLEQAETSHSMVLSGRLDYIARGLDAVTRDAVAYLSEGQAQFYAKLAATLREAGLAAPVSQPALRICAPASPPAQ